MTFDSGAPVALIVNNLGGTSVIEMNIVALEAINQLGDYEKFREFTELFLKKRTFTAEKHSDLQPDLCLSECN